MLKDNGLRGSVPPELSLMTTLQYLDLGNNDLRFGDVTLPTQLGLLTNLELLDLFWTYANGPIPSELGMLSKLTRLQLSNNNQMSGSIPSEVGMMRDLEELVLENCRLVGRLPPQLGLLLALDLWELNLEGNYLTGPIPNEFNDAIQLRRSREAVEQDLVVRLGGSNSLTGSIPEGMCALQRLKYYCDDTGANGLCGCEGCECLASDQRGNPDEP